MIEVIGKWTAFAGLVIFAASTITTVVGQEIGLGLMFVGWLLLLTKRSMPGAGRISLEMPIIALAVAWTLSTIFAVEPVPSFVNLKKLLLIPIMYAFFWLIDGEKSLKIVVIVMALATLVACVYGIVNYATGTNLAESYRVRATLSSTVTLAGVLLLVFSLSFSLALLGNAGKERILFLLTAIFSFVCLILTYTRGAWLGGILSMIVTYVFSRGKRKIAAVVGIALLAVAPILSEQVRLRVASTAQIQEMSIRGRFSMWLSATDAAKDHPLFGVGLMDLGKIYDQYLRPDFGFKSGHMHSDYFQVLASTGLVGLLAFLWFLRSMCGLFLHNLLGVEGRNVLQRNRFRLDGQRDFLAAVCVGSLAGFCGFVIAGIFEWNFGDAEVVSTLYCLLGLTCACARIGKLDSNLIEKVQQSGNKSSA